MKKKPFTVAIAGAGPAGLLLARELARAGLSVTVFDRSRKNAIAHNWSDVIEIGAMREAGFDMPAVQDGKFKGKLVKKNSAAPGLFEPHAVNPLQIWAPDMSCRTKTNVEFRYITVDRIALDDMLRKQAAAAGAKIIFEHEASGLLGLTEGGLGKIRIQGLRVKNVRTGKTTDVRADITVDATGHVSALRTTLGADGAIENRFGGADYGFAFRTVRTLDRKKAISDPLPDHYRYGAYKGYFWTHLHDDDTVDVGGGVKDEPGRIDPATVVKAIIAEHPSITAKEFRGGRGKVLVGKSPWSLAASGFIVVGDAAGQVIPTTGCGVGAGMTGALLAAKTILEAARAGDTGIAALWSYNRRWFVESGRGANLAALGALKDILQDLSHDDLAFLIRQDILSGEMLTPSINGIFFVPDFKATLKTLARGITRPGLLMKLNDATGAGKRVFRHYARYPASWDQAAFGKWMRAAARYFG
jgi:digeranylgeranylglycerophospholipid reductase